MITGNIVGYQISATSDKQMQGINPATLEHLPESFSVATSQEVDLAVEQAFHAWRIFRNIGGSKRAEFLTEIATGIEALGDVLVSRVMQETGYPEARVIVERTRTCGQLRMFAEIAREGNWDKVSVDPPMLDRTPNPRPELRKFLMSLGPVVVFGASNFPLAFSTAGGDVASAFCVGCPVIVKAHDSHLGTNALVAEVVMKAAMKTGMTDGVFSSLIGDGLQTGKQLVQHPLTAAVGFTGSLRGGRALFDLGQQREKPIPVFAEMGSVNPVFLLPGKIAADPEALAALLVGAMTLSAGQFCTSPGLFVALNDEGTSLLIDKLREGLEKVSRAVMLNNGISESFRKGVATIRSTDGVKIIHDDLTRGDNSVTPVLVTVAADIFLEQPKLHHEVFGPFSMIVMCDSMEQMKQVAEAMEGQLTAAIHATPQESEIALTMIEVLKEKAGRIIFNGVPTGVEVCASMTHGGPYPATTDGRFTAVGHHAVQRWLRPVTFQNFPDVLFDQK